MSKVKEWLGGSSDDAAADKDAKSKNPSAAGTQDPALQAASEPGQADVGAAPINILRDDRNVETADESVNPHNEAAAQKPSALPLDDRNPEEAQKRAERAERLRNPKTHEDRADALKEWGRDLRLRGGAIMSADWERFQELTGERTAPPSAADIAEAERKRDQGKDDATQRAPESARTK